MKEQVFKSEKSRWLAIQGPILIAPFTDTKMEMISMTPLEHFAELKGLVMRKPFLENIALEGDLFRDLQIEGKALLIQTGWDIHWNTEKYYNNHPFLTEDAALVLKEKKVRLVGIDSHNMDDTRTNRRPVHTILLGNGILIVEHLCNLSAIPDENFIFNAIPPKFKGVGTFPVRAMARLHRNP